MSMEIVEYKAHEAAIADIQRFKGLLVDVSTPEGLAAGKSVQRQVGAVRIALEKTRQKLKADVLERGRRIDGDAKPLFARVAEIEDPISSQINAAAEREEREQAAKIEAERLRIVAEQEAAKKAEEARMAEQRAEIKRQQDELAKAAAEQARIAAESRAKIEAEERAARMKIEEEQRKERLARQAREEVERVKRQEEELRLKAERDKLDAERRAVEEAKRKEQAEAEAKAKAVRDAEEAKQREKLRLENELKDGREMLMTFLRRFGKRAEFVGVAEQIRDFLGGGA